MGQIEETYSKTIELYELPEVHLNVEAEFISDSLEHEEINVKIMLGKTILADNLDNALFMLLESSNEEMKQTGIELEGFIEEMRSEASSYSREQEEYEEYQEELADLNAEYWSTR